MFSMDGWSVSEAERVLDQDYCTDANVLLKRLLADFHWDDARHQQAYAIAKPCVHHVRESHAQGGAFASLMQQYHLSSDEGIALMCLAEALARVPDAHTKQDLIVDKLTSADWQKTALEDPSFWSQTSAWALSMTGRFLSDRSPGVMSLLHGMLKKLSGPVLRQAVTQAMQVLSQQFVMAETIEAGVKRSQAKENRGHCYSFDMLGEAAHTQHDAEHYFSQYAKAIEVVGREGEGDIWSRSGVSVKLSALAPRYEWTHAKSCVPALTRSLKALAVLAKQYGCLLTVDAEEANRLSLSLSVIQSVYQDPDLLGWGGLGLAIQAYQKRTTAVIDQLNGWVAQHQEPLHIRLVKGAYWDSEVKFAQVEGHSDYPVWTRKVATDVHYMLCAERLLKTHPMIHLQFAGHNVYSMASVLIMAQPYERPIEFQCLHGMGEAVMAYMQAHHGLRFRVYAPVGQHRELLPYLVRRILENGANSSFVNQMAREDQGDDDLLSNPVAALLALNDANHPHIPLPSDLYGISRKNSHGFNGANALDREFLFDGMQAFRESTWQVPTSVKSKVIWQAVHNPADLSDVVGQRYAASDEEVEIALDQAQAAYATWHRLSVQSRAACLRQLADLLEAHRAELMVMLMREAGKVIRDGVSEVREAVDFCRYYADQAEKTLQATVLPGPTGERNELHCLGRGVVLCISPWNFPLAIFLGQVVAALVAGNAVIAKPAEQTSLIAGRVHALMDEAGFPSGVCQLLIGSGSKLGPRLCADERVQGVMFTGSTAVAQSIHQTLANRSGGIVPFIAETGGQNAMVVDSSALLEQVVVSVLQSAFGSAGQRCSACRVLYVQEDIAADCLKMLSGALKTWSVGSPADLATDVGPVIDTRSLTALESHEKWLSEHAKCVAKANPPDADGHFMVPCVYLIESIHQLKDEHFGPILHVVPYAAKALDEVIDAINGTGFGLTFGMHSRIHRRVAKVIDRIRAGNVYINRNMIGAVVGVQPFGGMGLSGTGPKAGGPHYLQRLVIEKIICTDTTAAGGNASLLANLSES